jgi:hypothetical protein
VKWVVAVILMLVVCVGLIYVGFLHSNTVYVAGFNQGYTEALDSCGTEQRTGEGKRDKR